MLSGLQPLICADHILDWSGRTILLAHSEGSDPLNGWILYPSVVHQFLLTAILKRKASTEGCSDKGSCGSTRPLSCRENSSGGGVIDCKCSSVKCVLSVLAGGEQRWMGSDQWLMVVGGGLGGVVIIPTTAVTDYITGLSGFQKSALCTPICIPPNLPHPLLNSQEREAISRFMCHNALSLHWVTPNFITFFQLG